MPVIAAAPWSTSFVVGADDGTAHVISLGRSEVVACFETVFSAHGPRIAPSWREKTGPRLGARTSCQSGESRWNPSRY